MFQLDGNMIAANIDKHIWGSFPSLLRAHGFNLDWQMRLEEIKGSQKMQGIPAASSISVLSLNMRAMIQSTGLAFWVSSQAQHPSSVSWPWVHLIFSPTSAPWMIHQYLPLLAMDRNSTMVQSFLILQPPHS